jgi:hypothetical protein
VPDEVYDAEVRNRMEIERYLTFRIHGTWPGSPRSLPRSRFDLAAAMTRHAETPPLPLARPAPPDSAVLWLD